MKEHLCEQFESHLAPYALRCSLNVPHEYPQEHPRFRSFFKQDKDRILHSEAFRRLGYKTQVFVVYEGDFYRTRLTHSLEVSQIARSIAIALRANEDVVEAISYAHDLGHPPFGHRGEETLDKLFKDVLNSKFNITAPEKSKFFEQNFQSYRIVSELEKRYSNFPGLNLSIPVLKGLLRHETAYDTPSIPYPLELINKEKIERIKNEYFQTKNPPLEAQIVNLADQIAWVTHDLEDALRVRFISIDDLKIVNNDLILQSQERIEKGCEKDRILFGRILIRNMIDILINDIINENSQKFEKFNSPEEVQSSENGLLSFSKRMEKSVKEMRDFLMERVYTHPIAERMSSKAAMILERIFFKLTEDIENESSKSLKLLPFSTQEVIRKESHPIMKIQVIIDFISGMTDRFASEFYKILFEPEEKGITTLY